MNRDLIDQLIAKRRKVAQEICELNRVLSALDNTIRVFKADYRVPKPPRGGITRPVLEVLREANAPLTTQEIADALGLPFGSVKDALKLQKRHGVVTMTPKGRGGVWEVTI